MWAFLVWNNHALSFSNAEEWCRCRHFVCRVVRCGRGSTTSPTMRSGWQRRIRRLAQQPHRTRPTDTRDRELLFGVFPTIGKAYTFLLNCAIYINNGSYLVSTVELFVGVNKMKAFDISLEFRVFWVGRFL